LCVLAKVPTK